MRDLTLESISHEVLLCGTFLEHCLIIKDMIFQLSLIHCFKAFSFSLSLSLIHTQTHTRACAQTHTHILWVFTSCTFASLHITACCPLRYPNSNTHMRFSKLGRMSFSFYHQLHMSNLIRLSHLTLANFYKLAKTRVWVLQF